MASAWTAHGAVVFLAVGLVYPAMVTLMTFEANRQMGPGVAGALGNLAPLFAVTGAAVLLGNLPTLLQIVGVLTIMTGAALLSVRRGTGARQWPYWAAALPLGASMIRGMAQPATNIGLASWANPFAALLLGSTASTVIVAAVAVARDRGVPTGFSRTGILWFCCVGISNGLAALTLYAALAHGPVVVVAPLAATYPLVTVALSALLLRSERITAPMFAGILIAVIGVALLFGR